MESNNPPATISYGFTSLQWRANRDARVDRGYEVIYRGAQPAAGEAANFPMRQILIFANAHI
jgi:hypothetical protein